MEFKDIREGNSVRIVSDSPALKDFHNKEFIVEDAQTEALTFGIQLKCIEDFEAEINDRKCTYYKGQIFNVGYLDLQPYMCYNIEDIINSLNELELKMKK